MIANIIDKTILVLTIAIIIRALLSWFPNIDPRNPLVEFIVAITEPILVPIRAVMPRIGMIDLTPMIAIILLQFIGRVLIANV
ncbi:MAG TPA: YggT family protein [Dehalococcoidia bacterium]